MITVPGCWELTQRVLGDHGSRVRLPFSIDYNRNLIFLPDRHGPNDKGLVIDVARVSPEYFATLGVPILQGRNFTSFDTPTSPGVPSTTAILRTLRLSSSSTRPSRGSTGRIRTRSAGASGC